MAKKRAGYETKLYHGAAGGTAATQILRAKDIELDAPVDYGENTDRGDGTKVPRKDRSPVAQDCKITWGMTVKDSDASLVALLAAATNSTPTPLAILYVNPVTGNVFDGDCYLKAKDSGQLGAASGYDFEAIPTTDGGRDWTLNGT
jgi:hypothetical protein